MRYGPIAGLDTAFESLRDIETKDGKLRALIIHVGHCWQLLTYTLH